MKVSTQDVQDNIKSVEYHLLGKKTTVCLLTMTNGHEIVGTSACVDPAEFNEKMGQAIAYKEAEGKAWGYLGFRLADQLAAQKEG